ncbi:hypothetical protein EVAR_41121_1 [Eumeta japonica]|uniref:Uncharacterized protein n=1 Tax=Eumeta variegata TaxID=151549 RepID=A0A4C1XCV2_EUMVA|nr:hypothetical protein EVAR_41121_1 [Eumeta japonica]
MFVDCGDKTNCGGVSGLTSARAAGARRGDSCHGAGGGAPAPAPAPAITDFYLRTLRRYGDSFRCKTIFIFSFGTFGTLVVNLPIVRCQCTDYDSIIRKRT